MRRHTHGPLWLAVGLNARSDMSMRLLEALFVLGLVGAIGTWFASRLNRDHIFLEKKARTVIRKNLRYSPFTCSPDSFVMNCVSVENRVNAKLLLEEISKSLQVPIDSLTFDAKLREVLRVSVSELGKTDLTKGQPSSEYIEPFTYDLLYVLEKLSSKKSWEAQWKANPELPRSEEALADFVMEMKPAELLRFFAPLVSSHKTRKPGRLG